MSEPKPIQSIGSLVSQLISRRGYAEIAATDQFHSVIASVVGKSISEQVTVGKLRRGVLAVFATDSVIVQELTFQKRSILSRLAKELPEANVNDLRFKVQAK
ncbi:MAG: DUF721 domain-containing protein [Planctomycetota bacterium]